MQRGGEVAPTLHLIKVLKEKDQKKEEKIKSRFFLFIYLCVLEMASLFPKVKLSHIITCR